MPDDDFAALDSAYRVGIYEVLTRGGTVRLRIGETPPVGGQTHLDPPLAVLTAYNPGSNRAPDKANERAQRELRDQ